MRNSPSTASLRSRFHRCLSFVVWIVMANAIGAVPLLAAEAVELAGHGLLGPPTFEYMRAFRQGRLIAVTLNPQTYPQIVNQQTHVYVVAAKNGKAWTDDPTLVDVRISGPTVKTWSCTSLATCTFQLPGSSTLSASTGCVGSPPVCIGLGKAYDVVVDFDRNGVLGAPDFIDGAGDETGMYVVHDTSVPRLATSLNVLDVVDSNPEGNEYDLPAFNLLECGINIQDPYTYNDFPQEFAYPTNMSELSGPLPLVVISHGNGHCYSWYRYLAQHLASYGYIVMSHPNETGPGPGAAANTTLRHTDAFIDMINSTDCVSRGVPPELCGRLDSSKIAWIGHSRGGNGVVWARNRLDLSPEDLDYYAAVNFSPTSIRVISSMAPIDFLINDQLAWPGVTPYHLIWGGGDRDVSGRPSPCSALEAFGLLERATGQRQSVYIHGGAHGWFHDHCPNPPNVPSGFDCGVDGDPPLTEAQIHKITRGYYVALLKHYFEGNVPAEEYFWRPFERFAPFDGLTGVAVALEYRSGPFPPGGFVIDNYEIQPQLTTSSSGGAVATNLSSELSEGLMEDVDCHFDWLRDQGTTVPPFSTSCSGIGCASPPDSCSEPYSSGGLQGTPTQQGPPCALTCEFVGEQPMNGMTRSRSGGEARSAVLGWSASQGGTGFYEYTITSAQRDFTDNEFLSFRAAQMPRHPNTTASLGNLGFTVVLRDESDVTSGLPIGNYSAGIIEPYARGGPFEVVDCCCSTGLTCRSEQGDPAGCNHRMSGTGWQTEFETVRIRLSDFRSTNPSLDLSHIEAVRFEFPGTQGRIAIDDVEVTSVPHCPSVTPCNGQSCLKNGSPVALVDTGLHVCQPSGGAGPWPAFQCGQDTVHVATYACSPTGSCPSGTYLECH